MASHVSKRISCLLLILVFAALSACAPIEVAPPARPAKIAVVLGAGASRGFAHVGVLKVLESNNIPVHMIVGTSAGSFVGSLYAHGFNAFQLQKMSLSIRKDDIVDLVVPNNGFVQGERLEGYVNNLLGNTTIEKLRLPFFAVATDILTGEEMVFGRGNTGMAVRASCAIPGIFRPVRIGDRMYVDGGVVSPVAVGAARRQGADVVIAVDISADVGGKEPTGTIETILQAITIMYSKLAAVQLAKADVVIKPNVGVIGSADFEKRHEAIIEGEKAALQALPRIQAIVEELRRSGRL